MHYVESPHRLPYETASGILQAEIGCSYNRCRFCSLCRKPGKDYRPAPREEVEADLDALASYVRRPSRINPFGMPRDILIPLLERIHEKLPEVKTIGGFCRVADVKAATDEDLATWARLGVQGLSIGAESAYDPALKFMRKPHTAADLEQQCARLDKVGIDYTLCYLAGMAGAEKCSEAARASAEVFSRINPLRINIMTLTVFDNADLAQDVASGAFIPAAEHDIEAGHDTNMVHFDGVLPRDQEKMALYLEQRAEIMSEEHMRLLRSRFRAL